MKTEQIVEFLRPTKLKLILALFLSVFIALFVPIFPCVEHGQIIYDFAGTQEYSSKSFDTYLYSTQSTNARVGALTCEYLNLAPIVLIVVPYMLASILAEVIHDISRKKKSK